MRSWSISSRFILSIMIFSLPLLAMIYYLYQAANEQVMFSAKEVKGSVVLEQLTHFQAKATEIHFQSIASNKDIEDKDKESLTKEWSDILSALPPEKLDIEKLKKSLEAYLSSNLDEKKVGGRFLMFNQDLVTVRENIADSYNIVLDPDLDSFYLMDALINWLPKMQEFYIQIGQFVGGADDVMLEFQKSRLLSSQAQFEEVVKRIIVNLDKIKQNDSTYYGELDSYQKNYQSYQDNIREQLREVYSLVINADRTLANKAQSYQKLSELSKKNAELILSLDHDFDGFLQSRMKELKAARNSKLYMSVFAMIVAILFSAYLGYTISRTIRTFYIAVQNLRADAGIALEVGQNLIHSASKVSEASSTQAAAIEETSASLEELSSMVSINAQNSLKARELANEAKNHASQGSVEMQNLIVSMNEISESSKQIEEIMKIIDDIAFQTNLLALNASVEAARAGEHGKGFAVVADAVRALAQKSADSAKEIGTLITDSLHKIENGKKSADRSGASMKSILGSIENVNSLNGEIASASQEQTTGIQQISKAVSELERATIENSGVAQQSSEYSAKSLGQAEGLMRIVDVLEAELLGTAKQHEIQEKTDLNFQEAIQAHLKWRGRLKNYVDGVSSEKLNSEVVCQDNQCAVGKWIYGSGQKHNHIPTFVTLKKEHALFHKAAGEVVKAVESGDVPGAKSLLSENGEFEQRTKTTVAALQELSEHMA